MPIYPTKTFDYNFDNPACYPGSGTTVTDLQGNLNLAFVGTPTFSSSTGNGSYFSFDAANVTSNHLASAFSATLDGSFNCSMSFCIRAQDLNQAVYGGINSDNLSSENTFRISRIPDQYWYSAIGYAGENVTTVATPVGKWVVVTVTSDYTNNQIKTYINGSLVKTDAFTTTYSFSDAQVILGFLNSTPYFSTSLGDSDIKAFSFWKNVVLTAPQVEDVASEFTQYTSIVSSYDFSDPACYPGSGSTVFDLAGSLNLPISGPTFISNGNSSYFQFSGSSNYIGLSSGVSGFGNTFSISIWAQSSSNLVQVLFFAGNDAISSAAPAYYYNLPTSGSISGSFNYGTGLITEPFVTNTWENYIYTADGTTAKLYKNGVLEGSISQGGGNWPTGQFYLGYPTDALIGKVAVLDVYNVALGSTAILDNYNSQAARFDNLVASYDFSDSACYPGSGNTVFDLSGSGLDLPISGATYAGTGQSKYFSFDGVNDYIGLQSGYTGLGNTFTISEWINPNSPVTFGAAFSSGTNTGSITGPTIYTDSAGGGDVIGSFNFGVGTANTSINADEWSLITFTGDGTTVKLYKDGQLVDTASQGIGTWNNGSFLMGENAGGSAQYSGKVAVLEVYNVALGSTAITDLYENESPRFGVEPEPPYVGIVGGRQFNQGFNG